MQVGEFNEFRQLVVRHFENYPGSTPTQATISSWWDELSDMPLEILPESFSRARAASPQFIATLPQVKAIADVEIIRFRKRVAEQKQQRYLPATSGNMLEVFYSACDREMRQAPDRNVGDEDEPVITALVVGMLRCYGMQNAEAMAQFGRWCWSDFKQRKMALGMVINGLRKVPTVCPSPPTIGMADAVIYGEDVSGWPKRNDEMEASKGGERWSKIASYWEQENEHWKHHPEQRPENATQRRFGQFWKLWNRTNEPAPSESKQPSPDSTPSNAAAEVTSQEPSVAGGGEQP